MKKYVFRMIWLLMLGSMLPISSSAWNSVGHMVVAKIAYDRLTPTVRTKVDNIVASLSKEYPNITRFEQIGFWPDTLRYQKIELFSHWHYIDYAFSDDGTPVKNLIDTDNIVWAINKIEPVVKNERANPYERARFLAFLVHLVGDIHQPLHTVSRISAAFPDGDRGGNLFPIKYKMGNVRIKNLHQLWDGGVGTFETSPDPSAISELATNITTHYPATFFGQRTKDLNPENWAKEGYTIAKTVIYKTTENETPLAGYITTNQHTAEQCAALAGYRLAELMNQLLEEE